jgi:hypothetical protein
VRATITQVEKFNTAKNTFYGKFGYLPGDINAQAATQFGFMARGAYAGMGDGNGVLDGVSGNAPGSNYGTDGFNGEEGAFWVDLSSSVAGNLIEGGFNTATALFNNSTITGLNLNLYFPQAKLGHGNYFYVWSGYLVSGMVDTGINYYGLSAVTQVSGGQLDSTHNIAVAEAYAIDKKVDDGLPESGNVMAWYVNGGWEYWADGTLAWNNAGSTPETIAIAGSATSCYDNGNNASATINYSLSQNNGAGANCALSFKFQ